MPTREEIVAGIDQARGLTPPLEVLRACRRLTLSGVSSVPALVDGRWFAVVSTATSTFAMPIAGSTSRVGRLYDRIFPVGTRSVLFGVHHWALHPVLVALAWRKLYGAWPTPREAACIFVHDLGYLGKRTIDGADGKRHPVAGATIAERLFGAEWGALVLFHSGDFAKAKGGAISKLYAPDKLSFSLSPRALYLALARLTGELHEYRATAAIAGVVDEHLPDVVWFDVISARMAAKASRSAAAFRAAGGDRG